MSAWTVVGIMAAGGGLVFLGVLLGALIAMPQRREAEEKDGEE